MKPTHNVYAPHTYMKGEEKKTSYTLVGSGWVKDDTAQGQVISIKLRQNISVSGELVLFEKNNDEEQNAAE